MVVDHSAGITGPALHHSRDHDQHHGWLPVCLRVELAITADRKVALYRLILVAELLTQDLHNSPSHHGMACRGRMPTVKKQVIWILVLDCFTKING